METMFAGFKYNATFVYNIFNNVVCYFNCTTAVSCYGIWF